MESNKAEALHLLNTMEELKASNREVEVQHATLGVLISTLQARISTLEAQLKKYACGETERISLKLEDSTSSNNKKPADESAAAATAVNLTVVGPDGRRKVVRMKRNWLLKEVMSAWCLWRRERLTNVIFLFRGRLLRAELTPQQLGMVDGDEIIVEKRWI